MDSDNSMASVLKRKRAPVEVLDTPKRTKSSEPPNGLLQNSSGWDAAFRPPPKTTTNGEENQSSSNGQLASPEAEAIDYALYVEKQSRKVADPLAVAGSTDKKRKKEKKQKLKKAKSANTEKKNWRISAPIGGRMIDADPVFTADEKYAAIMCKRVSYS